MHAHDVTLTSSNLPIIVIDTDGEQILDEPKISAHMGIIYNGLGEINNITDPYNPFQIEIIEGTSFFDQRTGLN